MNRWLLIVLTGILLALVSIARDAHRTSMIIDGYFPLQVKALAHLPLAEDEQRIIAPELFKKSDALMKELKEAAYGGHGNAARPEAAPN